MKPRLVFLIILGLMPAVILLSGCGGGTKFAPIIPVTGAEPSIPAVIEKARGNALEYLSSSPRFAITPSDVEWQLDDEQFVGEYRYHSGGWHMVIWPARPGESIQRIVLINKDEHIYWCGYIQPDGNVVDTSYYPD